MEFIEITASHEAEIRQLSALATAIVKEHFDPIIGPAQNDYMIGLFQTVPAITDQLHHGYRYFFVRPDAAADPIGFLAFYPKEDTLYLSKFYLTKEQRGKGYARQMLAFLVQYARAMNLPRITLNVNRNNSAVAAYKGLGFLIAHQVKSDIGNGFFMDDYVMEYPIPQ